MWSGKPSPGGMLELGLKNFAGVRVRRVYRGEEMFSLLVTCSVLAQCD